MWPPSEALPGRAGARGPHHVSASVRSRARLRLPLPARGAACLLAGAWRPAWEGARGWARAPPPARGRSRTTRPPQLPAGRGGRPRAGGERGGAAGPHPCAGGRAGVCARVGSEMPAEKPPATERPCQPLMERGMAVGGTAAATVGSGGRPGLLEKPAMGGEGSRKSPDPHPPASESEKDSGFSDTSSESLSTLDQAEVEEPSICASRWATNGPRLRTAPDLDSTFTRFTPVYIVKNVILKQPLGASSSTQLLTWSGQAPPDSVQGQARLIFLQQPVATATLKPLLPGRKPQAKDTFLPILNAYPKIAPHPGHSRENEAGAGPPPRSGSAGHAKSKRFCLEEAWVSSSELDAPTSGGLREEQRPGGTVQVPSAGSSEPLSQNTVTSSTELARPAPSSIAAQGSQALLDLAEGRILAKASKKLGSSLGKQRRFHNTVEILRKSGLLGVTLRTKELIRQNSSTQREIAELREHARLLCEAMQSNNSQTWARLQAAMSLSASYWARRGTGPDVPAKAKAEAATPPTDFSGESLPASPMNLALTPDLSAHMALP